MKLKRSLTISLLLLTGVLIAVAFGLIPVNLFFAKNTIADAVRQNLGVELNIHGSLSLRLGFNPTLSASSLALTTADQPGNPLLSVKQLVIKPVLFDVLSGDIHLKRLEVSDAVVNYCPDSLPGGDQSAGDSEMPSVAVDLLKLTSLDFECGQSQGSITYIPQKINLEMKAELGKPMQAELDGLMLGEEIKLTVSTVSSINEVLSADGPIPFEAMLNGFRSDIEFRGEIQNLDESPRLATNILAHSSDPAALLEVIGFEATTLKPIEIKTDLQLEKDRVGVANLTASIGLVQFGAEGEFRDFSSRPYAQLNLQMPELDFQLLNEALDPSATQGSRTAQDFRPWLEKLQQFDADLEVSIDQVLSTPLPMRNIKMVAKLEEGLLSIEHGSLQLSESLLELNAGFDTTKDCPRLNGELNLVSIDLAEMSRLLDRNDDLEGSVERIGAKLGSCGESIDDHLQTFHIEGVVTQALIRSEGFEGPVVADQVSFEVSHTGPGSLVAEGELMGERLRVKLGFGSISKILGESSWPLAIHAEGGGASLMLDGNAAIVEGAPRLQARVEAGIEHSGKLHHWINTNPTSALAGKFAADIELGQDAWSVTGIEMQLGKSQALGEISRNSGQQNALTVSLSSRLIDIGELSGLLPKDTEEKVDVAPAVESEHGRVARLLKTLSVSYELSVEEVTGLDFDISEIKATGSVQDSFSDDGRLEMTVEDIEISGKFETDFRQDTWKLDYAVDARNVDIGRLLAKLDLTDDVVAHADRAIFRLASKGMNIRELYSNLHLDTRLENVDWIGDLIPDDIDEDDLQLPTVRFTIAPSKKTEWSASGYLNEVPVELWLQTPTLTETFNVSSDFAYRLALRSGKDVAIMDALIDRRKDDYFRADFTLWAKPWKHRMSISKNCCRHWLSMS